MKMWILNLGKPVNVPSLNDAMAIDLGANILGEAIIFVIAAGILFAEYSRQVRKEEKKEAMRKEELGTLNYTIQELYFQLERQDAQIRELHRTISTLEDQVVRKPWKPISNKPSSPPSSPSSPLPASSPLPGSENSPSPVNLTPMTLGPQIHAGAKLHHHVFRHHHDVIPVQLEHFNKVVIDNPGVVLTAVTYLTNDIFHFKNHEYYSEVHLQSH